MRCLLSSVDAFDARRPGARANRRNCLGCARRYRSSSSAERPRRGDCLAARPRVELAQDRRDVVVDGAAREHEALGDLGVAQAVGDQREHLELARRQLRRRSPRSRPRPARNRRARRARAGGVRRFARRAARPARCSSSSDLRSACSSSASESASAASYGRARARQAAAAARVSPASSSAHGSHTLSERTRRFRSASPVRQLARPLAVRLAARRTKPASVAAARVVRPVRARNLHPCARERRASRGRSPGHDARSTRERRPCRDRRGARARARARASACNNARASPRISATISSAVDIASFHPPRSSARRTRRDAARGAIGRARAPRSSRDPPRSSLAACSPTRLPPPTARLCVRVRHVLLRAAPRLRRARARARCGVPCGSSCTVPRAFARKTDSPFPEALASTSSVTSASRTHSMSPRFAQRPPSHRSCRERATLRPARAAAIDARASLSASAEPASRSRRRDPARCGLALDGSPRRDELDRPLSVRDRLDLVVGQIAARRSAARAASRARSGVEPAANRSARAYWAAASRCAPSRVASSAAAGA